MSAGRTTESANERRSSRARWARAVGILIGLVGTAFVVRVLVQNREEVGTATANADWVPLVGAFIAACLGMTGIGLAWRAALRTLGARLGVLSSLRGYFVGQLGKYVPGGVWAIMGRGEWARAEGVGGPVAYSSVLLSMGSAYLAAILLSATLMPFARILGSSGELRLLLVLLLLPLGFALIHPRIASQVLGLLRRFTRRPLEMAVPRWGHSASIVLRQVPSWLLIGSASALIGMALGDSGDLANIVVATSVAWVVGFIALPVPGGIGVREATFVTLATSMSPPIAATVAVIARVIFVLVDVIGAAVTSAAVARSAVSEAVKR